MRLWPFGGETRRATVAALPPPPPRRSAPGPSPTCCAGGRPTARGACSTSAAPTRSTSPSSPLAAPPTPWRSCGPRWRRAGTAGALDVARMRALPDLLTFSPATRFDAIFAWDLLDFVGPAGAGVVGERLAAYCHPRTLLYLAVSREPRIPGQPGHWEIVDGETVLHLPSTPGAVQVCPRFLDASLLRAFPAFKIHKSYLLKHGLQEYLLEPRASAACFSSGGRLRPTALPERERAQQHPLKTAAPDRRRGARTSSSSRSATRRRPPSRGCDRQRSRPGPRPARSSVTWRRRPTCRRRRPGASSTSRRSPVGSRRAGAAGAEAQHGADELPGVGEGALVGGGANQEAGREEADTAACALAAPPGSPPRRPSRAAPIEGVEAAAEAALRAAPPEPGDRTAADHGSRRRALSDMAEHPRAHRRPFPPPRKKTARAARRRGGLSPAGAGSALLLGVHAADLRLAVGDLTCV